MNAAKSPSRVDSAPHVAWNVVDAVLDGGAGTPAAILLLRIVALVTSPESPGSGSNGVHTPGVVGDRVAISVSHTGVELSPFERHRVKMTSIV